ncbi:5-deoxy-glucuronate isomerase [Candidatus Bathyarchaeota archaeon]|nr:5-deoxy-glucuronate isomerase [Candidatus Bathyarchaeota archaeon]
MNDLRKDALSLPLNFRKPKTHFYEGGGLMAGRLFKKPIIEKGYMPIVHPGNSELKYLEYGILFLPKEGDEYSSKTEDYETVLTVFSGKFKIIADCPKQNMHLEFSGSRSDVFSDKPTAIYLPRDSSFKISALSPMLEIGVSKAKSDADHPPAVIKPEDVAEKSVGAWNWRRKIRLTVVENVKAHRIIVGETINPPGNWSSFPPHKHDRETLHEAWLEEVYFFKFKPSQGFGFQRIYTPPDDEKPFDEVYVIENGDTVVLPRGYHPVVAAPGYQLYYLWTLAGERRAYGAWSDDPKHGWLRGCEAIINDILGY